MMPGVAINLIINVDLFLMLFQVKYNYDYNKYISGSMVGDCRDGNYARYEAGKLEFFSDSEIGQLRIDGIRNELRKRGVNAKTQSKILMMFFRSVDIFLTYCFIASVWIITMIGFFSSSVETDVGLDVFKTVVGSFRYLTIMMMFSGFCNYSIMSFFSLLMSFLY